MIWMLSGHCPRAGHAWGVSDRNGLCWSSGFIMLCMASFLATHPLILKLLCCQLYIH
jgi:hypothetical protein